MISNLHDVKPTLDVKFTDHCYSNISISHLSIINASEITHSFHYFDFSFESESAKIANNN